jgi:hypothetical protein
MDASTTAPVEQTPTQSSDSETPGSLYLVSFAVAIILYALSPGPVVKYLIAHPITGPPPRAYEIGYAPLTFCYNHFPLVHRFYDWYFKDLWGLS